MDFQSIKAMMNGIEYKEPSLLDRANLCKKHFFLLKEDKHEKVCVNLSKHFSWYLKVFLELQHGVKKLFVLTLLSR